MNHWRAMSRWGLFGLAAISIMTTAARAGFDRSDVTIALEDTGAFVVSGLEPDALARLIETEPDRDAWTAILAVTVKGSEIPMLGRYRVEGETLRFEPRFPLEPGVSYQARLHRSAIPGTEPGTAPVSEMFAIAEREVGPASKVVAVYPSAEILPENQLRFYVHFSAPMSRGEAYEHVQLRNNQGEAVLHPFLELGEELWDPSGTRLTLLIDPGRIKQGLVPREEFGPVLEEGRSYTLVIDSAWPDVNGRSLSEPFEKSFRAGPADEESPDPETWTIEAPASGSIGALALTFPEPLDHGMLHRVLHVVDAGGKLVPGTVEVDQGETRWQFTPRSPWNETSYRIVVDTALEDRAGNSIAQPFEVDVFDQVEERVEAETIALPFRVTSSD